jgi:hypothetical protein
MEEHADKVQRAILLIKKRSAISGNE